MIKAVQYGLSHFADFKGRTDRPTFWWWVLAFLLLMIVLGVLETILMGFPTDDVMSQPLTSLASLVLLVPNLAMSVRRLHDIGRSGWWVLIGFIPILGALVLIYFYLQPTKAEPAAEPAAA